MRGSPGRLYGVRAIAKGWVGRGASALREAAVLLLAGAVPAAASAQQSAPAPTALVFDGVTVIDVEQGRLIPKRRVVIVDNRIQTVGSGRAVPVPQGAQVVDASGKYLIPGLWDMHVHPHGEAPDYFYPLFIANGVTGIRDAYSQVPLDTVVQWHRDILAGTRVGPPRQLLSGVAIVSDWAPANCQDRPHWTPATLKGLVCVTTGDSADVDHLVQSLKQAGATWLKTYAVDDKTFFLLAAAARRAGMRFGGHQSSNFSPFNAADSGASIFDHVEYAAGGWDTLCVGPQATVERCRPVAERLQRSNTWWVPTLTRTRLSMPSLLPDMSGAIIDSFEEFAGRYWAGAAVPGRWLHDVAADATDSLHFLSTARQAGLPILAGTDVVSRILEQMPPGFALHVELAVFVAKGLTPLEALQAATLNPAKMLRGTDSLGTVAPGKLADLVLLDANPLADITNMTTIRAVVANGRYFDRAALDALLVEVQAKGPRP